MTTVFERRIRVGGDPRDFGEYKLLCDELAKLSHPACPDVDWNKAEQWCLALFNQNGVDLQTAAFYTLVRSQLQGLDGMAQGLAVIEALGGEWPRVWPSAASVRLDILAWLFAQLQPLLRGLEMTTGNRQQWVHLDAMLASLQALLESQSHAPVLTLHALRQQLSRLLQRQHHDYSAGALVLRSMKNPEPAFVTPIVILPAPAMPEVNAKKRHVPLWLFGVATVLVLAGVYGWHGWLAASNDQPVYSLSRLLPREQVLPEPVSLDSLSLFDAGKAELNPGSTKVLINALASIKAQPGWLIVIAGHADATGDAQQNLRLSHARASAVRDWMRRMGDIPENCFAVQAFAANQPIASNDSESGRMANRRVDIRLVPQAGACGQSEAQS